MGKQDSKKSPISSHNPKKRKAGSSSAPAIKDTSSSAAKRALKHERQSHRKHADIVAEAKVIWNKLRLKSNTKEEVRELTENLAILIKGKAPEIVLQHDASRVVQAVLQFGTNEARVQVLQELCNSTSSPGKKEVVSASSLSELAKNQYAHFVVLKSIKYGVHSPECIKMIVKSFKGHIPKLAVHATGSKVIESLFQTLPNKSTVVLKQEFYGPHFALFASDLLNTQKHDNKGNNNTAIPDLSHHLKQSPDKKEMTLTFVRNILNKGMEKSLFGYNYFQELFAEYIANASTKDIRDIAPSVADHSIHLLSSKAGTRVVAACSSYGTAKDRKRIMKSLKGFSKSGLMHRDAYLAILRLVQVTDDTVSTHKNIFQELLTSAPNTNNDGEDEDEASDTPALLELALDERACKLFLMLLITDEVAWKKLFDPLELSVMEDTNPTVAIVKGDETTEVATSKKDPETRREELMQHLQKPLIELCTNFTRELLFSMSGSSLIREIYHSFHPQSLVDSVVNFCESELDRSKQNEAEGDGDDKDGSTPCVFEDRVGHLAIKNLILCNVEDEDESSPNFASALFHKLNDRLVEVAESNRGAFVLSALAKVPLIRDDVVKSLKKKSSQLKKFADKSTSSAGYEALLKEIA